MTRVRTAFWSIGLACGLSWSTCFGQTSGLKPFSMKDEWTFTHKHIEAWEPVRSNEVRFSILSRNKEGRMVLGNLRAITADGQLIWQPISLLPPHSCLRDFLGSSDLGLANACEFGLKIGDEWEGIEEAQGEREQLKFRIIGRETVTVLAGTFDAIKIVGKGRRTVPGEATEEVNATFWFAPEVKAMARTQREYFSSEGKLLLTITGELSEVKLH